ncbi:hypothetical protein [Rubrivirga marina]|uniref:hypothetical protein n=1 Tax=Rubrivirga marina TaxID=1196024 RepID=UPI00117A85F2|nr:hypothetical protein [Rubrivirga marina]
MYQDDVARLLRRRGWAKGAAGNDGRFIECLKYLGVTRRDGTTNTDLVRNGQEVGGALASLGRGEIKAEATDLIRTLRLPD